MLKNKALTFIISVYAVSALYSLLYLAVPYDTNAGRYIITSVYMFIPFICAFVLAKFVYRTSVKESISLVFKWNEWYYFAVLAPILLAFLAFLFSLLIPGVRLAPDMAGMLGQFKEMMKPEQYDTAVKQAQHMREMFKSDYYYFWVGTLNAVFFGATINALFGFGEEAGWRGFLLKELKPMGFYRASLIIGLVWGIWHIPVILQGHNYGEHHIAGIFMMTGWTVLLSPLLIYAVNKTGSVVAAAVMHGVLNASPGIALAYIKGGNELTVGITGAAGFAALIVMNAGLFVYDRYFAKEKMII